MTPDISSLFPRPVASASVELGQHKFALFPEEERLVAKAVLKRQIEFSAGRHCARLAMRELDHPPCAILAGRDRAPVWPAGLTGSITHCRGYCASVVARCSSLRSLGIDAERTGAVPCSLIETVLLPGEIGLLATLAQQENIDWLTLFFCAKEASYKALYQLAGIVIGFHHMHIEFTPELQSFNANVLNNAGGRQWMTFAGRYRVVGDLICAAAWPQSDGLSQSSRSPIGLSR